MCIFSNISTWNVQFDKNNMFAHERNIENRAHFPNCPRNVQLQKKPESSTYIFLSFFNSPIVNLSFYSWIFMIEPILHRMFVYLKTLYICITLAFYLTVFEKCKKGILRSTILLLLFLIKPPEQVRAWNPIKNGRRYEVRKI